MPSQQETSLSSQALPGFSFPRRLLQGVSNFLGGHTRPRALVRVLTLALLLGGLSAGRVHAQSAVPIDTSQSSVSLRGSTVVIQRLAVPGLGTFDAEFAWDGAGNFRLSAAVPSAPAGGGGSSGALRTCKLDFGLADVEIAVKASVLEVKITSKSNDYYFSAHQYAIQQGTRSSQIDMESTVGVLGYTFVWSGDEGFVLGYIPPGAVQTGRITWTNSWFTPQTAFRVAPAGVAAQTC